MQYYVQNFEFDIFFSWFRVRNNLLEPVSRTNRIFISGGILVIDALHVSIQFPYHYKVKKMVVDIPDEPLGDRFFSTM